MSAGQGWILIGVVLMFAGQHAKAHGRKDAWAPWYVGCASLLAGWWMVLH